MHDTRAMALAAPHDRRDERMAQSLGARPQLHHAPGVSHSADYWSEPLVRQSLHVARPHLYTAYSGAPSLAMPLHLGRGQLKLAHEQFGPKLATHHACMYSMPVLYESFKTWCCVLACLYTWPAVNAPAECSLNPTTRGADARQWAAGVARDGPARLLRQLQRLLSRQRARLARFARWRWQRPPCHVPSARALIFRRLPAAPAQEVVRHACQWRRYRTSHERASATVSCTSSDGGVPSVRQPAGHGGGDQATTQLRDAYRQSYYGRPTACPRRRPHPQGDIRMARGQLPVFPAHACTRQLAVVGPAQPGVQPAVQAHDPHTCRRRHENHILEYC